MSLRTHAKLDNPKRWVVHWCSKLWTARFPLIQIMRLFSESFLNDSLKRTSSCESNKTSQLIALVVSFKKHNTTKRCTFVTNFFMHVWILKQHPVAHKSLTAGILVKVWVVEGIGVVCFHKCGDWASQSIKQHNAVVWQHNHGYIRQQATYYRHVIILKMVTVLM